MSRQTDLQNLLTDVLDEAECPWSEDTIATTTLRHARRTRIVRKTARLASAVALVATVAILFRPAPGRLDQPVASISVPKGTQLEFVTTVSMPSQPTLSTRAGVTPILHSATALVTVIHTDRTARQWQWMSDDALLALLDDHPAALVRHNPSAAQLIFLHPEDQHLFLFP